MDNEGSPNENDKQEEYTFEQLKSEYPLVDPLLLFNPRRLESVGKTALAKHEPLPVCLQLIIIDIINHLQRYINTIMSQMQRTPRIRHWQITLITNLHLRCPLMFLFLSQSFD